jgi:hypothetical protein
MGRPHHILSPVRGTFTFVAENSGGFKLSLNTLLTHIIIRVIVIRSSVVNVGCKLTNGLGKVHDVVT